MICIKILIMKGMRKIHVKTGGNIWSKKIY